MPDVVIDIEIKDHGSPQKIKETDDALNKMKKQAEDAGEKINKFAGRFQSLGKIMTVAGAAITASFVLMIKKNTSSPPFMKYFRTINNFI